MKVILVVGCLLSTVDGDTVRCGGETYRLVGFDTPEHPPRARCVREAQMAKAAHEYLRDLIRRGQPRGKVQLTHTGRRDRYGRLLARLTVAGKDVGQILIGEGLARAYRGGRRGSWC